MEADPLYSRMISEALQLPVAGVKHTLALLSEGATVPFISRYRKEATGGLDEVQVGRIQDMAARLADIGKRKETIRSTMMEQGVLTDELRRRIDTCWDPTELEDIYLPYKPKRRTRAEMARQHGLEPLANLLMQQRETHPETCAKRYVNADVPTVEEALKGARDIVAERVSEDEGCRNRIRSLFDRQAHITAKVVKGKEEEGVKYKDYFNYDEPLRRCSAHRLLALRRGENEGVLRVSIAPDEAEGIERLQRMKVKGNGPCSRQVAEAVADAYKRLLRPSIETEKAAEAKARADAEAIRVFAANLRQLLLAAPLGQKRVLAIDPGFRTGCKVVCLDAQGQLLHNETLYPHPPRREYEQARRKLKQLVEQYDIQAIAIGNGTAGRETETFVQSVTFDRPVQAFAVSEDGASVYSASAAAREEFPDYDVTVRGAVSIGRRLMDPLAELVKIDPKAIGVGQYQHDVNPAELKRALDSTVESCVNAVGVEVNTASRHLLTYVSGLGPQLAQNIVNYRNENGPFRSRRQLLKVPRMGAKAFEQSAGFLRIAEAENPLDGSAVHPERYDVVERMARDLGTTVKALMADRQLRSRIPVERYVSPSCGLPTLTDILAELDKPGRDPRSALQMFAFDPNVHTVDDLHEGMWLPGIVTNITGFGCFVDIGIHEQGLVHISQMANHYVSEPATVVCLHQHVRVRVLQVDKERKRIALSLKSEA